MHANFGYVGLFRYLLSFSDPSGLSGSFSFQLWYHCSCILETNNQHVLPYWTNTYLHLTNTIDWNIETKQYTICIRHWQKFHKVSTFTIEIFVSRVCRSFETCTTLLMCGLTLKLIILNCFSTTSSWFFGWPPFRRSYLRTPTYTLDYFPDGDDGQVGQVRRRQRIAPLVVRSGLARDGAVSRRQRVLRSMGQPDPDPNRGARGRSHDFRSHGSSSTDGVRHENQVWFNHVHLFFFNSIVNTQCLRAAILKTGCLNVVTSGTATTGWLDRQMTNGNMNKTTAWCTSTMLRTKASSSLKDISGACEVQVLRGRQTCGEIRALRWTRSIIHLRQDPHMRRHKERHFLLLVPHYWAPFYKTDPSTVLQHRWWEAPEASMILDQPTVETGASPASHSTDSEED